MSQPQQQSQVQEGGKEMDRPGIRFGVSMGFNWTLDELFDSRISILDTTLKLERTTSNSFMLSTTASFPIRALGGTITVRKRLEDGTWGPWVEKWRGLSVIATVNLVTFNSAIGGTGLFNQKLDGGLGLGYMLGERMQFAVTYEMLSFRQPREFIRSMQNKPLIVSGHKVTSISEDDNDYFMNKYVPSISIKFIYNF